MLSSIGIRGLGSGGRLFGRAMRTGGSDGLRPRWDSSGRAAAVAKAGRRSGLRRLVHGHLLTTTWLFIVGGGGGSTLQVVVVISVPSPIIFKISCVDGGSPLVMVLGTRLRRQHVCVSQSLDDLVLVGFSIGGGSPDIGKRRSTVMLGAWR